MWYDQITPKFVKDVAIKYAQENPLMGTRIFPQIFVDKAGYIGTYSKESFLKVGDPKSYVRVGAAESKGVDYATGKEPYFIEKRSTHKDVTEDDLQNYDNPFDPVRAAISLVTTRLNLVAAKLFVQTVLQPGIWGTDFDVGVSGAGGKWSSDTGTPIKDVLTLNREIQAFTGFYPNAMAMTGDVYDALVVNSDIRNIIKVTQDKIPTPDLLARAFNLKRGIEVFSTVETTAKEGTTPTKSNTGFMASNVALIVYSPTAPSVDVPSGGYYLTYRKGGKANGRVKITTIPMPQNNHSLRIEGDSYFTPKILAPDLGVLLTNIV